jgi:hypothetical protein
MDGLVRCFAPLRRRFAFVAGNDAAAISISNFKQPVRVIIREGG